jgi:DNA-binding transcriptional regulator LsrR (DeoR family)
MPIHEDLKYSMKLRSLYYLYEKGYTQTEIAKRLNISRVTLSKWLEEARAENMIKFQIVDVRGELPLLKLEEEMKELFGLRDVKLINSANVDDAGIMWKIATQAAPYFQQLVRSDMKIGLTWGRTLNAMISELPKSYDARNLSVYTLVGSVSGSAAFQPNILAQNLLNKFSGSLKIITAPFLCPTEQLCSDFRRMREVAAILDNTRDFDMTLVGIGEQPMESDAPLSDYPFDRAMILDLIEHGAVGDICGNFFDIDGKLCDTSIKNRILSVDITELPKHKMVVGIGGGSRKVKSILGALHGGYLDILITDSKTAMAVVEMEKALRGV